MPRIQPAHHHHDTFPFFFTGLGAGYGWNSASYYRPYYNYPYYDYPYYGDPYYDYPPATSYPAPVVPLDVPLSLEPNVTPKDEAPMPFPDSETVDNSLLRRLLAPKEFPAREAPEVLPEEPVSLPSTTAPTQPVPRETRTL